MAAKGVPLALYGPVPDLEAAAGAGAHAARAIFPVLGLSRPFLDEARREELWAKFQVPIYALLVDGRGEVVGYECEAQDGIHLREDYAARLLTGHVESSLCECGRPGPRLMPEKTAAREGQDISGSRMEAGSE